MSRPRLISSRTSPPAEVNHPCLEAFEREFGYLVRTFRRLGVRRDDVEDMAHEVFLVLYQAWEKYDPARPLRAYLFGIAFRIACNNARKRRKETLHAVMEISDFSLRPDQALEASQVRSLVLSALERVPLPRRAVLIMHDLDQLSMAEIAANLSIHRFTGYSRLRKGRKEFASAVSSLLGASGP